MPPEFGIFRTAVYCVPECSQRVHSEAHITKIQNSGGAWTCFQKHKGGPGVQKLMCTSMGMIIVKSLYVYSSVRAVSVGFRFDFRTFLNLEPLKRAVYSAITVQNLKYQWSTGKNGQVKLERKTTQLRNINLWNINKQTIPAR